jgi:hypothetical protein
MLDEEDGEGRVLRRRLFGLFQIGYVRPDIVKPSAEEAVRDGFLHDRRRHSLPCSFEPQMSFTSRKKLVIKPGTRNNNTPLLYTFIVPQ